MTAGPEKQKKFHEELMAEHQTEGDAAHETHVIAGYKSALKSEILFSVSTSSIHPDSTISRS